VVANWKTFTANWNFFTANWKSFTAPEKDGAVKSSSRLSFSTASNLEFLLNYSRLAICRIFAKIIMIWKGFASN